MKEHTKKSGRHRYPLDDLDPALKDVFESTHPDALPSELVSMVDSEDPLGKMDRDDLIRRINDKEQAVQVSLFNGLIRRIEDKEQAVQVEEEMYIYIYIYI